MSRCKDFWIKKPSILLAHLPIFFILLLRFYVKLALLV
ncbi:unknown protein [Cronobacter turicensis z3032]|uniref:Uncharacterized protein n=1 Tax=Cronobacter turicensis (strain DSM 18703 / CCUG 55852 / LMG 23827 / z3032) TaxID=693216 RepID=C9Y1V0_CROTZ|nr:unknown protein [Cronobacter turicensis z3032]